MMNARFVTALIHLDISQDLGRGDKLDETTFITNSRLTISDLIDDHVSRIIGILESKAIRNAKAVIYGTHTIPDDTSPLEYLDHQLANLSNFQSTLWMIKDNSVTSELGYLIYDIRGASTVTSNFLATKFSTATGKFVDVAFNREELRAARKLYREAIIIDENPFLIKGTRLSRETTRTERALYFLQTARNYYDLGLKIAAYCSGFEALFSTSQAELAHQLSERVACFVAEERSNRLPIYRQIKEAYGIRSRIIHGGILRPSAIDKLPDIASNCDEFMRMIMVKILRDDETRKVFEARPEDLDEYMLTRLLG